MLLVINSMSQLDFDQFRTVYAGSSRRGGRNTEWQDFDYLHDVFFPTPGAFCAVWVEGGRYVSALRMEPYEDGLLLEGLETAPDCRGRGYAARLLGALFPSLSVPVYSHVDKRNKPSLVVHRACGFTELRDSAVLLDGTVTSGVFTLVWKRKNNT